ncbi:MAG: SURF1 family protein [Gemmatimonadales bacterium]
MRRVAILAVAALAALVCARLGVWQLDRLDQRRQRNATIEARLAAATLTLPPLPDRDPDSLAWRRAQVGGTFDLERQVVVMARSHRGTPAVHVVTPLLVGDGVALLVERGWAPSPDGRTVELRALQEPARGTVTGVLLSRDTRDAPSGGGWPRYVRTADPATLDSLYPYDLVPLVLRRTARPDDVPEMLRLIPQPELDDGPHLSYAIQWFAFATIAIVGGTALFVRRET